LDPARSKFLFLGPNKQAAGSGPNPWGKFNADPDPKHCLLANTIFAITYFVTSYYDGMLSFRQNYLEGLGAFVFMYIYFPSRRIPPGKTEGVPWEGERWSELCTNVVICFYLGTVCNNHSLC
jgi:hypothetical protein